MGRGNKIYRRQARTRDFDPESPEHWLYFADGHLGPAVIINPNHCKRSIHARSHWEQGPDKLAVCKCDELDAQEAEAERKRARLGNPDE